MSQPVKVGFVGTGGIANSHLRNLVEMENVRIAALCDIDEVRVRTQQSKSMVDRHTQITARCLMGWIWMLSISVYRPSRTPTQK